MAGTFVLNRSDVRRLISFEDAVPLVEEAYAMLARGEASMPPKLYLDSSEGDLRVMPSHVGGEMDVWGTKIINVHPGNREAGLPSIVGRLQLNDPATGYPLAYMDATHITALRTGAASAVAMKYLARDDVRKAAIVGAGAQALYQALALEHALPALEHIAVYDASLKAARTFAGSPLVKTGMRAYDSLEEALEGAGVVTTITPSREPYIHKSMLAPGAHINAIGADAPGKQEVHSHVTCKVARVYVDEWAQASHSGEINVPVDQGFFKKKMLAGTIGDVIVGKAPGRRSPDEVTLFDSTGLSVQDVACGWHVLRRAQETPRQFLYFDFER